jgi:hypothetical protein
MIKTTLVSFFLILIILSCKVSEKDMVGLYELNRFPKTTLKINADKSFEFVENYPNPYLHPFDHPDEYYAYTKGTWQVDDKKNMLLTSQKDTLIYPLASLKTSPANDKNSSNFKFFDSYGDLVKILYVKYSDSSEVSAFHKSMDSFDEDLTKRDTLEFHFYGYKPYTFLSSNKTNQDYIITLKPSFYPNFFVGKKLKPKCNKLIFIKAKAKIKFTKVRDKAN